MRSWFHNELNLENSNSLWYQTVTQCKSWFLEKDLKKSNKYLNEQNKMARLKTNKQTKKSLTQ